MSRVEGRVVVHPVGSGKPSEVFHVSWLDYPKSDRAKVAKDTIQRWAKNKYRGCSVYVETGTIASDGDQGHGKLHVNGLEVARYSAVVVPAPVQTESLFGGGL